MLQFRNRIFTFLAGLTLIWVTVGKPLVILLKQFRFRMIDMLPDSSEVKKTNAIVEENFGGFGSLVAVITSKDSALNSRLVQGLAKELEGNRYINFVEYKSEMDFFEKHKLLYVNTEDLRKIRDRISDLQSRYKFENSPLQLKFLLNCHLYSAFL